MEGMLGTLVDVAHRLVDLLPLGFLVELGADVELPLQIGGFPAHFSVIQQAVDVDGGFDRAAFFARVLAIAEAALLSQFFDVGECAVHAFPGLQLAQARGVDEQRAAGGFQELAVRGGVAATAVGFADGCGRLALAAKQAIDQRRLPRPRRSYECDGFSGHKIGTQRVDSVAVERTNGDHIGAGGDGADLLDAGVEIGAKVGFVQKNRAVGAARSRRRVIAFQPAWVEIAIEAGDNEDRVDVGGDHLRFDRIAHCFAKKNRATRHHFFNDCVADTDEIADGGELFAMRRLIAQLAGEGREDFLAVFTAEDVGASMFDGYSGNHVSMIFSFPYENRLFHPVAVAVPPR